MSIWGYTTKKDLTSLGSYLSMGIIGIIIASLANIFFRSSGFSMLINYVCVIIFTVLTAYETQNLKILANATKDVNDTNICSFNNY